MVGLHLQALFHFVDLPKLLRSDIIAWISFRFVIVWAKIKGWRLMTLGPCWVSVCYHHQCQSSHIRSHGQADLTNIPKRHRIVSAKASEAGQYTERWNNLGNKQFFSRTQSSLWVCAPDERYLSCLDAQRKVSIRDSFVDRRTLPDHRKLTRRSNSRNGLTQCEHFMWSNTDLLRGRCAFKK